jgi:hypothetical protein
MLIGVGLATYLGMTTVDVEGLPEPKMLQSQAKLDSVVLKVLGTRV